MIINKNSWSYKVYSWYKGEPPTSSNLCPYTRTVLLWAPLKFLFAKGKIKKVPVPAIVIPALLFEIPRWAGMVSYDFKHGLYIMYLILATCATGAAGALGTIYLGSKLSDNGLRKKMSDEEWAFYVEMNKKKDYLPFHLQKEPFINRVQKLLNKIENSLIYNYIKAKHEKICPTIYFEEEKDDTVGICQGS